MTNVETLIQDHTEDLFCNDGDVLGALSDFARDLISLKDLMDKLEFEKTVARQRAERRLFARSSWG